MLNAIYEGNKEVHTGTKSGIAVPLNAESVQSVREYMKMFNKIFYRRMSRLRSIT